MSINSFIQDGDSNIKANVENKEGINRLHVLTEPYKDFKNRSVFFTNPTYGSNMNQDFSSVASTENVHDGNDNTYWTGTIIVGQPSDFNFSSTDQAHTGNQSISCVNSDDGDQFQLANDTLIDSGLYDRFVGWVYVTGEWTDPDDGLEIIFWNTNTGTQVSENSVDLDNYIDGTNTGVWQKFSIPFRNFGVFSDDYDAIRFKVLANGGTPPNFYLDDLALEEIAGDPAIFSVEPEYGTWWHVQGMGIAFAAPYNATLADATMPNIPYKGILGVSLTSGITYQRTRDGEIQFAFIVNDLIDILNQYNTAISSYGHDGTDTFIKLDLHFREPFTLKSEYEDYISFNIVDDLSGLSYFRVVADVKEEFRS